MDRNEAGGQKRNNLCSVKWRRSEWDNTVQTGATPPTLRWLTEPVPDSHHGFKALKRCWGVTFRWVTVLLICFWLHSDRWGTRLNQSHDEPQTEWWHLPVLCRASAETHRSWRASTRSWSARTRSWDYQVTCWWTSSTQLKIMNIKANPPQASSLQFLKLLLSRVRQILKSLLVKF